MKRVWLAAAVFLAATAAFTLVSLPPRRLALVPAPDHSVPGVIHVHTSRSDGRGTPDEVAQAAAHAGLKFVVFTDHGDGTTFEPPAYRHGVLCIDGVEISTTGGHYVALDMPPSSYPLGGEPRDVVEDVRRLGGFGYPAHPDSPKVELRWTDWSLPVDGLEIVNPDTSWRVRALAPGVAAKLRFLSGLLTYPFRPEETLAGLLTDPSANLARWNSLASDRAIVGLAGTDAHAKLALWNVEPGDNRYSLPFPSYGASFRTQSVHVEVGEPFSGDARADGAIVMKAVRSGHLFLAVDAMAAPPSLDFSAVGPGGTAREGDEVAAGAPLTLHVHTNAPPSFETVLWRGSSMVARSETQTLTMEVPGDPAAYRVEIRALDRPERPVWLLSNPIYVRPSSAPADAAVRSDTGASDTADTAVLFGGDGAVSGWRTESNAGGAAMMDVAADPLAKGSAALTFKYQLSHDLSSTAAILVETTRPFVGSDRLRFRARSDRPMRVSVQLRTFGRGIGPEERWHRSVYFDRTMRDETIDFDDMTPLGPARTARPALSEIRHLLFVIDTTNTKPDTSGQIWIERVALQAGAGQAGRASLPVKAGR